MNFNFQNISNFKAICRICLGTKTKMICMMDETNHMLKVCNTSSQKLCSQDKYPQQICIECLTQLKNAYQFQQQFEYSLQILNKIIIQSIQSSNKVDNQNDIHDYEIKIEVEEADEDLNVAIKEEIVEDDSSHRNIELDEININDDWIKSEEFDNNEEINSDNNDYYQDTNDKLITKFCDNVEHSNDAINVIVKPHKILDFICNICKSKFINRERLLKHIKTHINLKLNNLHDTTIIDNNQGKFKCDKCLKGFMTLPQLIAHCEHEHQTTPIKCKQCDLEFVNYLQMLKHEQSHLRKYVCEHCGIIFDQLSILESHKLSSHSDTNCLFVCSICDKSYSTISTLKSHVKTVHATRFESWDVCTICRKLVTCIKIHYLKFHGRIKNGNNKIMKVHSCWCCDIKFGSWYALKRHMLKHGVERPNICTICDKGFRFESVLEVHLRTQHSN